MKLLAYIVFGFFIFLAGYWSGFLKRNSIENILITHEANLFNSIEYAMSLIVDELSNKDLKEEKIEKTRENIHKINLHPNEIALSKKIQEMNPKLQIMDFLLAYNHKEELEFWALVIRRFVDLARDDKEKLEITLESLMNSLSVREFPNEKAALLFLMGEIPASSASIKKWSKALFEEVINLPMEFDKSQRRYLEIDLPISAYSLFLRFSHEINESLETTLYFIEKIKNKETQIKIALLFFKKFPSMKNVLVKKLDGQGIFLNFSQYFGETSQY